jgi:hypothetical protein
MCLAFCWIITPMAVYATADKTVACKKILFIPEIHCWPKWLYILCVRKRERVSVCTYACAYVVQTTSPYYEELYLRA